MSETKRIWFSSLPELQAEGKGGQESIQDATETAFQRDTLSEINR